MSFEIDNNRHTNLDVGIGNADQVGRKTRAFFEFDDASSNFVDSFGVALSNAGNFVYTITINCADSSGNEASDSVTVSVPHSRGKGHGKGDKNK